MQNNNDPLISESSRNELGMCLDLLLVFFKSIFTIFFQYVYELFVPRPLKDVKGQLALITGGSKGLGRALALSLAKKGCNIAIICRDTETGEKTAKEVMEQGVRAKVYQADVSNFDQVSLAKQSIERDLGPVDILINNAGVLFEKSFAEEKPENYLEMVNINFSSIIWTTKLFLDGMIERKRGHIVSMSSVYGLNGEFIFKSIWCKNSDDKSLV